MKNADLILKENGRLTDKRMKQMKYEEKAAKVEELFTPFYEELLELAGAHMVEQHKAFRVSWTPVGAV